MDIYFIKKENPRACLKSAFENIFWFLKTKE